MTLGEKIRYLRTIEGQIRGFSRPLTQNEISQAIQKELGGRISQSYLSQIENGQRKHLTATSRELLGQFFRVHPGYLVDDPEDSRLKALPDLPGEEEKVDAWLLRAAGRFRQDAPVASALVKLAQHPDTRKCIVLVGKLLDNPEYLERLWHSLERMEGEL